MSEQYRHHHQTSPDSHFTQKSICSLATETGRISLSDDHLIITEDGEKRNIPIHSSTERTEWLRKVFKIVL
ncbi:arylamine N-acetyltransferase [Kroppenstedtia pulmonis]|uniref:Arylamine N-acetyltransferase n=1 Tax=Kroppenstedtia pulmonis TaxID=1380685 RepID=A0A7D3XRQ2_9BACL|nr:arylamine N-acetyltransferase [Kroppenstedtia pulmonis]